MRNHIFRLMRGTPYPQHQLLRSADPEDALMVGSPQLIVEKILRQHELFGHQRVLLQMDVGGVPFDKVARNIELVAERIAPAVRKHTAASASAAPDNAAPR